MVETIQTLTEAPVHYLSQAVYTASLRSAIYGLWRGALDMGGFIESFTSAVFSGLSSAWFMGARSAGIERDEMTDAELQAMQVGLFQQMMYIPSLGNFIQANSKANGRALSIVLNRLPLWVSRYSEFFTRGRLMAKRDQKHIWRLGATDKHCGSCVKLDGKVKRASQWVAANIYPKCPDLECHGYYCGCTLSPTTDPMSKGRLPKLP
jgi:hypothetical protein